MVKKLLVLSIFFLFIGMSVFTSTGKMTKDNFLSEELGFNDDPLLYEDFSGPFPPDGWETDYWTQCNKSCCNQEPPCACLFQGDFNNAYITSKPVDASNYEKVNLRFFFGAYFYYPHYSYFFIKIRMNETSPWKDITPWDNPPNHDLEPFIYDIKIILEPGGQADAFQVNWSYMGHYYYLNYAFLEDVMIYHSHPNYPPETPEILGKRMFKEGENGQYPYKIFSTDPDGDDLFYIIDWLDGEIEEIGPYASGENLTIKVNIPAERGTYSLFKIKARDIYGAESNWAILEIIVPRDRMLNNLLFLKSLGRFPFLNLILNMGRCKFV